LGRLLGQLRHAAVDVIVVNVEADADVAAVARDVTVVDVAANVGYAAAVNIGVGASRSDVVLFTNDDVLLTGLDVAMLADAVREGADVAVPAVVDGLGNREPTISALASPRTFASEWLVAPDHRPAWWFGRSREKWREPKTRESIEAAAAVLVATRRRILIDFPLPEAYFLYWEEQEWFWRLRRASKVVIFCPDVVIRHVGGRLDVRADKSRLLSRNSVRYLRRTQGRGAAARGWPIVILWNLRLLIVDAVRTMRGDRLSRARLRARLVGVGAAMVAVTEIR
jgi:GT2 family glycosyltransferase